MYPVLQGLLPVIKPTVVGYSTPGSGETIRFLGGIVRASANITLFLPFPSNPAFDFNFDGWFGGTETMFRLGHTPFWLGFRFGGFATDMSAINEAGYDVTDAPANYLAVGGIFTWDRRDTVYTPSSGRRGDLSGMYVFPVGSGVDSSDGFLPVNLTAIAYEPREHMVFGTRFKYGVSIGNVPAWARQGVSMRGVPIGSTQGDHAFSGELDFRFHVDSRWDIGLFGSVALALDNNLIAENAPVWWKDLFPSDLELMKTQFIYSIGTGFRYQLSRAMRMSGGLDVAFSNKGWAITLVLGNPWR